MKTVGEKFSLATKEKKDHELKLCQETADSKCLSHHTVVNPGLVEPKGPGSRGQEQWMYENVLVARYLMMASELRGSECNFDPNL
jgi:hypothetical protein